MEKKSWNKHNFENLFVFLNSLFTWWFIYVIRAVQVCTSLVSIERTTILSFIAATIIATKFSGTKTPVGIANLAFRKSKKVLIFLVLILNRKSVKIFLPLLSLVVQVVMQQKKWVKLQKVQKKIQLPAFSCCLEMKNEVIDKISMSIFK